MRTFNNVKLFGTGITGATGAKHNNSVLIRNGTGTNTVTLQCLNTDNGIEYVGPISLAGNTVVVWPTYVYGFTASSANVTVYELF
jgi:hypothetical protein